MEPDANKWDDEHILNAMRQTTRALQGTADSIVNITDKYLDKETSPSSETCRIITTEISIIQRDLTRLFDLNHILHQRGAAKENA